MISNRVASVSDSVSLLQNSKVGSHSLPPSSIPNKRIFTVTKFQKPPFNIRAVPYSTSHKSNGIMHIQGSNDLNKGVSNTAIDSITNGVSKVSSLSKPLTDSNAQQTFEYYRKYCKAYCINIILANQVLSLNQHRLNYYRTRRVGWDENADLSENPKPSNQHNGIRKYLAMKKSEDIEGQQTR